MKKIIILLAVFSLAACNASTTKKAEAKKSEASTSKEVKKDSAAKTDADIILKAVLTGKSPKFKSVTGKEVYAWRDDYVKSQLDEEVKKYEPEKDYTLKLTGQTLKPADMLQKVTQTRLKIIESIGDEYEITDVKEKGDKATVTFKSRGIALNDMVDDISDTEYGLLQDSTGDAIRFYEEIEKDPVLKKKLEIVRYYVYYYLYDLKNRPVGYIEDQEFEMVLTKNKKGHYVLENEDFTNLRKSLFIKEYSKERAEEIGDSKSSDDKKSNPNKSTKDTKKGMAI